MKHLLLSVLLLSFLKSDGQTFDSSWFPRQGVTYTMFDSFDAGVAGFPTPVYGLNQDWDFSELSRTPFVTNIKYIDPSEAMFQDSFPNADVVKVEDDEYGTWEWYYRTSNDTLYQEGFALLDKFFELDTFFTIHEPNEIVYAYEVG